MNKAEARDFRMDPGLLFEVIRSQAGTLAKAVLEGAMNAVDAGADRFDITATTTGLVLSDNGEGFGDRNKVIEYFEVFGVPHKEGDAVYGKFRMGRGQLFSFGVNRWVSQNFEMLVDIQNKGLQYELVEKDSKKPGCRIEIALYDEISRTAVQNLRTEVALHVRYMGIEVTFNDEVISKDPATESWDVVTDDAYIRLTGTGGMDVYNLGAYVRTHSSWSFGTAGVVVSRRRLHVNFARNDVMSTCSVWKKIRKIVDQRADDKIKTKGLDDAGRYRAAQKILDNDWEDVNTLRLITDVSGRQHALTLMTRHNKRPRAYTVAPDKDALGDKVHQRKGVFVIAQSTMDRFGVPGVRELIELLSSIGMRRIYPEPDIMSYEEATASEELSYDILEPKKWTATQGVWARIASRYPVSRWSGDPSFVKARVIHIGCSHGGALAWTDGKSYITLDIDWLSRLDYSSVRDLHKFCDVIHHEYTHDSADTETDTHTPEFYEAFHDNYENASLMMGEVFKNLEKDLKTLCRRTNKKALNLLDRQDSNVKGTQELQKADALVAARVPTPKKTKTRKTKKTKPKKTKTRKTVSTGRRTANMDVFT